MRTIIISDLHNRIYWIENVLSSSLLQPYDRVIFLGDYFDDYGDTPDDAYMSAKWLKQSLKKPNRIHLYGTHDLWYRFPSNPYIETSGNAVEKYYEIQRVLNLNDWNLLKLYHYEQNYLMSHAGVHSYLISEYIFRHRDIFNRYIVNNSLRLSSQDIVDKIVKPATDEAFYRISQGFDSGWLAAGFSREGLQKVGGITWLDWNFEFEPIPGLNQIVGHSDRDMYGNWREYPGEKITEYSKNYCVDTRNRHIGILENSVFTWIDNQSIKTDI